MKQTLCPPPLRCEISHNAPVTRAAYVDRNCSTNYSEFQAEAAVSHGASASDVQRRPRNHQKSPHYHHHVSSQVRNNMAIIHKYNT